MNRLAGVCFLVAWLCGAWQSASAAEVNHTAGVLRVHPLANGTIVLMLTSDSASCTSTATPYKHYNITVGQGGVTIDGLRAIHAAAMTAYATNARLTLYFDDATSSCYVTRAILRE